MLNKMPEGSTVDYDALIEQRAATKNKFKLKKVVSSPGGLTVKGLTVRVRPLPFHAHYDRPAATLPCACCSHGPVWRRRRC